ncbi:peptidoglycan-binding domain-containing protein [Pararoseomonas sp. SCSIO 73927]|uniref:peptidoglycan-binding domain-containing protein n=1 Tax=Pararoseomonas sp. SCSIO 73927 TaxID=3114537 RepID=UPI0030CC0A34
MPAIRLPSASVGQGGINRPADVRLVQWLLNAWLRPRGDTVLKLDGLIGPRTIGAIRAFQQTRSGAVDGRVDPGGPSMCALVREHFAALRGAMPVYPSQNAMRADITPVSADVLHSDLLQIFAASEAYLSRSRQAAPSLSKPNPSTPPPNGQVA